MENSTVRQFKGFNKSNYSNFTQSGLIQTLHQQNNLGKSRIQNLPSHKRQNLSNKLDLVVVFQTIQIERLSIEIQVLRIKLKDSQRQIMNYLSYQIQIKQLTESCIRLQHQNQSSQAQIQKLNIICQKMYAQLQQMHNKYDQISLDLPKKCDILKSQNQNMQTQLQKVTEQNYLVQQQLKKYQLNLKDKEFQWNKKSIIFSEQIARLNDNILNQSKEIRNKTDMLQKQKQKLVKQFKSRDEINIQLKNIQSIADQKLKQISTFKLKLSQLIQNQRSFSQKKLEMMAQIQAFRGQIIVNQQLKKQIIALTSQNLTFKEKHEKKQEQVNNLIYQTRQKQRQLQQNDIISKEKLQNCQNQLNQKNIQISKLQNTIHNMQKKNKFNQSESQKLKHQLQQSSQLTNQIEELKLYICDAENRSIEIFKIIGKKQEEIMNLKKLIEKQIKKQMQNQKLEQKCIQIVKQLQKCYIQLDRQKNNCFSLEQLLNDTNYKIRQKQGQIIILKNQQKSVKTQLQKMNEQNNKLKQQFVSKQESVKNMHNSLISQKVKNKQINAILQRINKQLNDLKTSFKKIQQERYKDDGLKSQLINIKNQSQQKQKQISSLQLKIIAMEQTTKKIKQIQSIKQSQIKQLNIRLKKVNQIFSINQILIQKLLNLQNQVGVLQNQNMKLTGENKVMNFQMVQTHKINTMYKRRDSTKTASSGKSQNQFSTIISQNQGERQILQYLTIRN